MLYRLDIYSSSYSNSSRTIPNVLLNLFLKTVIKTNEFEMQMSFALGLGLSVFVGLGLYFGSGVFSKDPAVIHLIAIGIPVLILPLSTNNKYY